MEIKNLGSGSSGNCYILTFKFNKRDPIRMENLPFTQSIMVECGIPYKEMLNRAITNNVDLSTIKSVLVSHEHNDHAAACQDLERRGKKIFGPDTLFAKKVVDNNGILESGISRVIDEDILVLPFEVHHDVKCFGYVIYHKLSREKVLFITDTKYVDSDVITKYNFDYIIIECNYSSVQVHTIYNNALKEISSGNTNLQVREIRSEYGRVLETHMGDYTTKRTLSTIAKNGHLDSCKAIFLIHLSQRHSVQEQVLKNEFSHLLEKRVFVCKKNGGIV